MLTYWRPADAANHGPPKPQSAPAPAPAAPEVTMDAATYYQQVSLFNIILLYDEFCGLHVLARFLGDVFFFVTFLRLMPSTPNHTFFSLLILAGEESAGARPVSGILSEY